MTNPTPPRIVGRIGKMQVSNGRYHDGVRSYQRVTNLLKEIETDTWNLDEWDRNMHVIGLAMRPDLVLGVAAAAQYDEHGKLTAEAKSTLRGLRSQAVAAAKSKAGANQGTAVHTATERIDLGETVEQVALPYPFDLDLIAYRDLVAAMGIRYRPEHIERSVRNVVTDNVGTFDRLGESEMLVQMGVLAPGELIVVDVKTEDAPLYNLMHIAPQLAEYANAADMFVPEPTADAPSAGRYEPMPNVSRVAGLVIHVRNGRAVPYLIDLTSGWSSALRAAEQRDAMKASKIKLGEPGCWAVAVPIDLPAPARVVDSAAVAASAAQHAIERGGQRCLTCQKPITPGRPHACPAPAARPAETAVVQQAVTGADGNVTWHVIPDGPQPLEAMLWADIMAAPDLPTLATLFERASAQGIEWAGPIANAGIERSRIVQCPQRELHNVGACACGWREGLAP